MAELYSLYCRLGGDPNLQVTSPFGTHPPSFRDFPLEFRRCRCSDIGKTIPFFQVEKKSPLNLRGVAQSKSIEPTSTSVSAALSQDYLSKVWSPPVHLGYGFPVDLGDEAVTSQLFFGIMRFSDPRKINQSL